MVRTSGTVFERLGGRMGVKVFVMVVIALAVLVAVVVVSLVILMPAVDVSLTGVATCLTGVVVGLGRERGMVMKVLIGILLIVVLTAEGSLVVVFAVGTGVSLTDVFRGVVGVS